MRITVDDLSVNPALQKKFEGIRIMVDGVQHDHVVIADQEKGYIEKYKQNPDGSLALNKKGDAFLTEIVRGKVEFMFKDQSR
ncbi:hypothetical protein [Acinetobacter bohemicus]|uniref:hypothetical protein n=1 Tax=Acinetobacter bohemicus TaxID=1435036 RepID=UPI004042E9A0